VTSLRASVVVVGLGLEQKSLVGLAGLVICQTNNRPTSCYCQLDVLDS